MCGIIARIGQNNAIDSLLTGLENLEYRGYDSAGIAIKNGGDIKIKKCLGEVSKLQLGIRRPPSGNIGIGHTRWSTHGPPTEANAHPLTDTTGDVAVVHNGIIENYQSLKNELQSKGHQFSSDTDTEVIPHLINEYLKSSPNSATAFRRAIRTLEGSYAVACIIRGEEAVYAGRQGSPLVVGVGGTGWYLASDIPAFLDQTNEVIYLENGEIAILEPDAFQLMDLQGKPVPYRVQIVDWNPSDAGKEPYDHYMLKEIHSQPDAITNTIQGRVRDGTISLESFPPGTFTDISEVQIVGCGTSYHAALYSAHELNRAGIWTDVILASEYKFATTVDEKTLVLAVSQSGETADTLDAIRLANEHGARTIAVTNVIGSTAAREADDALFILAGPEIGVAATKTYSSQIITLVLLINRIAQDIPHADPAPDLDDLVGSIQALPLQIESILKESLARSIAKQYLESDAFFFIGRGMGYATALEGALKFKEITYEHAEGFPSGELKHGPLALVTEHTPIIAIVTGENDSRTATNAIEAHSRGAPIVAVAPDGHPILGTADRHLPTPATHPICAGLLGNVHLQLLAYHAASLYERPIDKPRNLAKSVTVA